jgi:hypothetical protein
MSRVSRPHVAVSTEDTRRRAGRYSIQLRTASLWSMTAHGVALRRLGFGALSRAWGSGKPAQNCSYARRRHAPPYARAARPVRQARSAVPQAARRAAVRSYP